MHVERPGRREWPADSGPGLEARAERLLAEYLRQWGLRDPSAIAACCRLWVRRVTSGQDERRPLDGSHRSENHIARAALAEAMNDMDR